MNQFFRVVSLTSIVILPVAGAIKVSPVVTAHNGRSANTRRSATSNERRTPESVPALQVQQAAAGSSTGSAPMAAQSAAVVAVDVSKSLTPFAPLIRAELLRIIRTTP